MKDPYEVLGIDRQATKDEIATAYRKLARKYHPDVSKEEDTVEKFKEVTAANEILSDDVKRSNYDNHGFSQRSAPFSNPFDIFGQIFGGRPTMSSGEDLLVECHLTLLEILNGGTKDISFKKAGICKTCNGRGGELTSCVYCDGKGGKVMSSQGMSIRTTCHACQGTGQSLEKACPDCMNGLTDPQDEVIKFNYPPGVEDGMRFVFRGNGNPSANDMGHPGNLFVIIRLIPHELFERLENGSILYELKLTYPHLVLGKEVEVPTLEGSVSLKIPPGTQANQKFKLKEMGLPCFKETRTLYTKGDQIVKVVLDIPKEPTEKYLEVIKSLAKLEEENG